MTRGAGWFSPPKALVRKRSAAAASRLAERRKSIVAPVESTARYKYTHLPFYPDVRLVHPPRVVCCLEPFAQAPIQLRGVPLDLASDGDVIHREPTLGQKRLDVA